MKPPNRPVVRIRNTTDMMLVISVVSDALKTAGADHDYIKRFKREALDDYKTVILTCYEYADICNNFNNLI